MLVRKHIRKAPELFPMAECGANIDGWFISVNQCGCNSILYSRQLTIKKDDVISPNQVHQNLLRVSHGYRHHQKEESSHSLTNVILENIHILQARAAVNLDKITRCYKIGCFYLFRTHCYSQIACFNPLSKPSFKPANRVHTSPFSPLIS